MHCKVQICAARYRYALQNKIITARSRVRHDQRDTARYRYGLRGPGMHCQVYNVSKLPGTVLRVVTIEHSQ